MTLRHLVADALDVAGRWLVGLALVGLLAIVSLQIIDRHVVDVPIAAPDAYARILLLWIAYVGFALAVRAGMAIRVDLMDHYLPAATRRLLAILFDLLKLAVVALLIVKGWALVDIGFDQVILGTDLSTAVPNAALWVSALMLAVFVTVSLIDGLTGRPSAGQHHDAADAARVE